MTAKELIAWRESLGLSQIKAANLLGVPVGTYRGWEAERRAPSSAATGHVRTIAFMQGLHPNALHGLMQYLNIS